MLYGNNWWARDMVRSVSRSEPPLEDVWAFMARALIRATSIGDFGRQTTCRIPRNPQGEAMQARLAVADF
jgi:hypothetical protein